MMVCALLATACGGSGDGGSPAAGPATTGGPGGGLAADYTGHDRMPESQLAEIRVRTSDEAQLAALKDGIVTYAEYEAAALNWAQCLRDRGVVITGGPTLIPGDTIDFTFAGVKTKEEILDIMDYQRECMVEHWQSIMNVWAWQTRPTEDMLIQIRLDVLSCLRERGHALPQDPAGDDPDLGATLASPDFGFCAGEAARKQNVSEAVVNAAVVSPPLRTE